MNIRKTSMAAAIVALAATATVAVASSSTPVLGATAFAPQGGGFGTPHPTAFFSGDDESGYVGHIHWAHWGAATATGTGRRATGPQTTIAIELRAHDLGSCPGSSRRAYRHLSFRQPTHPGGKFGAWHDWAGRHSICSQP
jgi:hypothetical protein